MTSTSHPAFTRMLVGVAGALLLGTVCLGTAVGPAQAAYTATVLPAPTA